MAAEKGQKNRTEKYGLGLLGKGSMGVGEV